MIDMRSKTRMQRIRQLEQQLEQERAGLLDDIEMDIDDGIPVARLSRDTGISRTTIHRRLRERRDQGKGEPLATAAA
ncbi:hypothetical protein ACWDKQ_34440 [Saccharopolyspora sp. NPDC000995]